MNRLWVTIILWSPTLWALDATQILAIQNAGSTEVECPDLDCINKALIEAKRITGRQVTITQKVFSADGTRHYTIKVE